jgi:hypothetical protein
MELDYEELMDEEEEELDRQFQQALRGKEKNHGKMGADAADARDGSSN